jgi:hypothetical protein
MTHSELINLLHKHKNTINEAYSNKSVDLVSGELIDSTLFLKVANSYRLNSNYTTFVNSILDRVDYGMVFESYKDELSNLIRYKNRFLQTKENFYKENILKLIDDIYLRFFYRDKNISRLLRKLEHEVSLEINIIIEQANIILENITELIEANAKINKVFLELKSLDSQIKERVVVYDNDFYLFGTNIDFYIDFLKRFITQTKEKRRQNRLFLNISRKIIDEDDKELTSLLVENQNNFYNLEYTKFKKIRFFIENDKRVKKYLKELQLIKPKKIVANSLIKELPSQKLQMVDIQNIVDKLNKSAPQDIYEFLLNIKEIKKDESEAFKIYLHLLSFSNILYEDRFNTYGIKVVKWEV